MIDLQPFCYTGNDRPALAQPWSVGEWTYATDGRILVRVPRRADVPERDDGPRDLQGVLAGTWASEPLPLPEFARVPAPLLEEPCGECQGQQSLDCNICDGKGKIFTHQPMVAMGAQHFNPFYLGLIAGLPEVVCWAQVDPTRPLKFAFAGGGEGRLMPMRDLARERRQRESANPMMDGVEMEGQPAQEQARRAIGHVLRRIREQPACGWHLGLATTAFALLTEAYATLTDQSVRQVRELFRPEKPRERTPELVALIESAIMDFEKLAPFIGGAAKATANIYREGLEKALGEGEKGV